MIKMLFLFLVSLSFITSCGDSSKSNQNTLEKEQRETEEKIKTLLTGFSFKPSEINATLPDTTITLSKGLSGFADSIRIVARKQGILLDGNKVLTTFEAFEKGQEQTQHSTYAVLIEGNTKKILHTLSLGSGLSVIDIFKKNDTSFGVDALMRESGKPVNKVKTFLLTIKDNRILSQ